LNTLLLKSIGRAFSKDSTKATFKWNLHQTLQQSLTTPRNKAFIKPRSKVFTLKQSLCLTLKQSSNRVSAELAPRLEGKPTHQTKPPRNMPEQNEQTQTLSVHKAHFAI
jgi:hypothetical protein